MSYYGVSVIVTIILTSLIAFYLLYKAKELNLGIVISISIGSIILGFTFSPAFNAVLKLLSDNINRKLALVISLLTVLFVFLLFILIISFIVSICIPKKLASIDCCVVIDRLLSKISIKNIKDKIGTNLKEIMKHVYNLKNKLKKPVDTKQIIDTMGIEISENAFSDKEGRDSLETSDTFVFSNLLGFIEPSSEIAYENQDNSIDTVIIDQGVEATESEYHDLEDISYEEVVATQISDAPTSEADDNDIDDLNNLAEITIEVRVDDQEVERDANSLVLKAFESRDNGRKEEAIGHYIEALRHKPDSEMIFWIVLDICALYKQLGLSELAKNILEGLVSEYGAVIQPEIKMEIMNNLQ